MKPGDTVIVRTSWMSSRNNEKHIIKNITNTGKIRLDNGNLYHRTLYCPNGERIERGWGFMWLDVSQ